MVTEIITLSVGKRLSCGLALSGLLLSAAVFGLATAETSETKVSKPVRILLTDDTTDDTLSVRRTPADQRDLDKLYKNELRPTKATPKKLVDGEILTPETLSPTTEPTETIEKVEVIPQTKSAKIGLDSVLSTLTFPKFDLLEDIDSAFNSIEEELSSATSSPTTKNPVNHHKSKLRPTRSSRDSIDDVSAGSSTLPSIDTLLPKIDFSKVDFLGDIEAAFIGIGDELSSETTSSSGKHTSRYSSKMQHPGSFTPRYTNRAIVAPVYLPTIGSLNGVQLPKSMRAEINSIFGSKPATVDEEDETIPTTVSEKLQEQTNEPAPDAVDDAQSARPAEERRGIIALLGLEELGIPEFNNPFAVGTGIKETEKNIESVQPTNANQESGEHDLEPDETVSSQLPSLNTQRPTVPGVNQIPTLAPKEIPDAPNAIDEQDKSARRMSPYKPLVNPDSFLTQRSAVPVSVRISDSVNR